MHPWSSLLLCLFCLLSPVEGRPRARKVVNSGLTQADGSIETDGVAHAASLRCHRFVLFAHGGHGGDHLAGIMGQHPEISMFTDPFGDDSQAIQDGLGMNFESFRAQTIRTWAEKVFTYAAKRKNFDDINPPRCAVGFKITDSVRGDAHTARMLAEHPRIMKIVLERRNVTIEYEEHMKSVKEEEEDKQDPSRKGMLRRKKHREIEAYNALPTSLQNPTDRPKNREIVVAKAPSKHNDVNIAKPPSTIYAGRKLLLDLDPEDVTRPTWDYVNLNAKVIPHKCRAMNCTMAEYYGYHREWFDSVKERLVTSGSTWMEVNTEETLDTCTMPKVLERIFLHLGVTPSIDNLKDCSMYPKVKERCRIVKQPDADNCGKGNLGRIKGHDVPLWAKDW